MAVTPAVNEVRAAVLARLTKLRENMETLVVSVAGGSRSLADVFAAVQHCDASSNGDEVVVEGFVYLVKIAEALPGVGKVRARRILAEFGLTERTRVRDVPPTMREAIVAALS